jgi:hypothetical protein
MNVLTVVLFGAGVILLYAGIKDLDPKQVISDALKGKDAPGMNLGDEGAKPGGFTPEPGTGTARV